MTATLLAHVSEDRRVDVSISKLTDVGGWSMYMGIDGMRLMLIFEADGDLHRFHRAITEAMSEAETGH